jgi:hypothetical protein
VHEFSQAARHCEPDPSTLDISAFGAEPIKGCKEPVLLVRRDTWPVVSDDDRNSRFFDDPRQPDVATRTVVLDGVRDEIE